MTVKKSKKVSKAVKSIVIPKIRRLYFDIETSPNIVTTWNVGYNLTIDYSNIIQERAIICICYKWEHDSTVYSLNWDGSSDKRMIEEFLEVIKTADEVVGHNGDRYDLKFFRTRAIYHGIKSLPEFKSIDTLKISKKEFRFNSNRLDYIGSFLGLGRKIKTEYGLWTDVMAGDSKALRKMIDYCKQDVVLLEAVYKKLSGYAKVKTHVGVANGGNKCDCPSCGSKKTKVSKTRTSAAGAISKQLQCGDCHSYFTISLAAYNKIRGGE